MEYHNTIVNVIHNSNSASVLWSGVINVHNKLKSCKVVEESKILIQEGLFERFSSSAHRRARWIFSTSVLQYSYRHKYITAQSIT